MNNFRQWARREGLEDKKPPEEVRKKIVGSMEVFDLVGNMVDLFIPRAIDVFKGMLGGSSKDKYHPLSNKGKFEDKELPKYPNKPDNHRN